MPIISINGNAAQAWFNLTKGVYEGCAARNVTTHATIPGTEMTTTCSVVLAQTLKCTTEDLSGKVKVSQQAVDICNAALTANSSSNRSNLIVGECNCAVPAFTEWSI